MTLSIRRKKTSNKQNDKTSIIGKPMDVRVALIAKFGAFALFLSTIEYVIPKPVPFMRLGLANVPVMIGLALLSPLEYGLLLILKVVGQALVNGTLFSYIFLFSIGGTFSAGLLMFFTYKTFGKYISFIGISIIGAMASNTIQLLLSRYIMFGKSAWLIAPPFLIMGFISSCILGVFVERFTMQSIWYKEQLQSIGCKGI